MLLGIIEPITNLQSRFWCSGLSVHLGLIVPDGEITMSVGFEQVRWEEGKVIAFDDTFIHQVGTKSHLREEEIEFFFFQDYDQCSQLMQLSVL